MKVTIEENKAQMIESVAKLKDVDFSIFNKNERDKMKSDFLELITEIENVKKRLNG